MRARRKGSAMIESTFVTLTFFFVIIGIVEFGRMVYAFNYVSNAARDGARYASVHSPASATPATDAAILAQVRKFAVGLDPNAIAARSVWTPNAQPGGNVKVTVTYAYAPVFVGLFTGPYQLNGTSAMTILR